MFNRYHKYILDLFKSAAKDIQEFFPEWVKEHPKIKSVEYLSNITKKIPVASYREKINLGANDIKADERGTRLTNLEMLQNDITDLIIKADHIINKSNLDYKDQFFLITDEIGQVFYRSGLIEDSFKTEKMNDILIAPNDIKITFELETPKGKLPKTIYIPAKTNLGKICKILLESIKKYLPDTDASSIEQLNDVSQLDSYKRLAFSIGRKFKEQMGSLSKDEFEIVFSTDAKDILSMSSRSDWTSCQNLIKEKDDRNVQAIYSAISPYVGIIYLTNKKNYQSRGEEMVARSTVFYVEDMDDKPALVVNKVYTNLDKNIILDIFKKSLSAKTSLSIINSTEAFSLGFRFPSASYEEIPYFDEPLGIKEIDE